MDNNKFSGEIITELFKLLPLSKLNLIKNELVDSQVQAIANQIKVNKSLQQIFMSHNCLTNESLGLLADSVKDNEILTEMFITHNDLSVSNGIVFI